MAPMYEIHWGLSHRPFENTPDPHFLYHSRQHEEAFGRLLYVIEREKGAALLSGVFGCGKTLLARALLSYLDPSIYKIALTPNPFMSGSEILMEMAA